MLYIGVGPLFLADSTVGDDRLVRRDGVRAVELDTVEFFNLVLGLELVQQERKDIVTFLRAL
jgi:hypothetical protein